MFCWKSSDKPISLMASSVVCNSLFTLISEKLNKLSHPIFKAKFKTGKDYKGRDMTKPVFGGLRTTQGQTSLRIRAV